MPTRRLRTALFLLLAATPMVVPPAMAENPNWPPPEDATSEDLSDASYWPDDPDYAWTPEGSNGQWNYYSFMVPNENVRPEETATGMSIDLAWRFTQGDPRVIIAVMDSGIKWDERDLVEAAFINHRELLSFRPLHADDSACGDLDPAKVFFGTPTAEEPSLASPASTATATGCSRSPTTPRPRGSSPRRPTGTPRATRTTTASSTRATSSSTSPTASTTTENGYVDDISGWDFMKNDNDPYDDTRYGHGTGEARDSVSQTNNGIGSRGRLPQVPLHPDARRRQLHHRRRTISARPSSTRPTTAPRSCSARSAPSTCTDFAQPRSTTPTRSNVLVITSMADENSRHHNMPAAANHTLPVHAIQYDGTSLQNASTFVRSTRARTTAGRTCLSASGTGCSSEATGQLSGIAGLVVSAGKQFKVSPPLTPGEAALDLLHHGRRHRRARVARAETRATAGRSPGSISASATAA
jgi:hypothetical protein